MGSLAFKVTKRIKGHGKGWVFTPKDFLDIGTRAAVDNILSRLTKKNYIRRLDKGIYDFPKTDVRLGVLSPKTDDLANAIAKKSGDIAFPSGATAANLMGFSTQVPAKPIYLTNSPSRTKRIGNSVIQLKHAKVPLLDNISFEANLALQAISYLGKDRIDDNVIYNCVRKLSSKDKNSLVKVTHKLPLWMVHIVHIIHKGHDG